MHEQSAKRRQPWAAIVLSLLCTGLGHIYCGMIFKGLVLFLLSLLMLPVVVIAAYAEPSNVVLVGLAIAPFIVTGIYVYAVVDSAFAARKLRSEFQTRDYNHGGLYVLFILVGTLFPIGSTVILRASVIEAFYIPASSMSPNLLKGDQLLVNKVVSRSSSWARGDVVVFRCPVDRSKQFVARIVGLPGDSISIVSNELYVNGTKLKREMVSPANLAEKVEGTNGHAFYETNATRRYMILLGAKPSRTKDFSETVVPHGCVFVLGDSRDNSRDSRHFGFVPMADIIGPVSYIHLPAMNWSRFGVFKD